MKLLNTFKTLFYEKKFNQPESIHKWIANNEVSSDQIVPTLESMSKILVAQSDFIEAIWCLMACKNLLPENSDSIKFDEKIDAIFENCFSIGSRWLDSEINIDKVKNSKDSLLNNFKSNFKHLILSYPVLCVRLLKEPCDRKISIECVSNESSMKTAFAIRSLDHDNKLIDPPITQPTNYSEIQANCDDGIVFFGMGTCHLINDIYLQTQNQFVANFKIGLFILESHYTTFKANLFINNIKNLLISDRVFLFIGAIEIQEFLDLYAKKTQLSPRYFFSIDPAVAENYTPIFKNIVAFLHNKEKILQKEINKFYNLRPYEQWRMLFNGNSKIKVLGFACLFSTYVQYAMRDWIEGFKQIGCEVDVMIEEESTLRISNLYRLEKIYNFKPDIVIAISYNRCNLIPAIPSTIPFINWQQDRMVHCLSPKTASNIKEKDLIVTTNNWTRDWLLEAGYSNDKISPHNYWPSNTNIYDVQLFAILSNTSSKFTKSGVIFPVLTIK